MLFRPRLCATAESGDIPDESLWDSAESGTVIVVQSRPRAFPESAVLGLGRMLIRPKVKRVLTNAVEHPDVYWRIPRSSWISGGGDRTIAPPAKGVK
jgi:hypothetical protein